MVSIRNFYYIISELFSDNPTLGHHGIKHIMIVSNFPCSIRSFHLCSMHMQVSREHPEYYPLFKLREFQKSMELCFNHLFATVNLLIPEKSLVHIFGWMKVKVIIITKSVHYGIKNYIWTGEENTYVLKCIFYTGEAKF